MVQIDPSEGQGTEVQPSRSTEVMNPEEHADQSFKIAGNKYYIRKPEKTFKCHEDIIGKIQGISGLEEVKSVEECDFLVVFCMIASRAGTDIEAALKELNKLSESKPIIFMVLHHTFDKEKTVPDSSKSVNRINTLTVDLLFYEDEGLLECMKNTKTLERIEKLLQSQIQEQAGWFSILYNIYSHMPGCRPHVDPDAQAVKLNVGETGDKQKKTLVEEIDFLLVDKEETFASELLIVLLGMSGSGKSAAKSLIFGRDERSQAGVSTPTQKITKERGRLNRDQVSVLDTPDWFSSGFSMEQIKQNIQLISMCSSGPYALLPVIPIKSEFTVEERVMVNNMEKTFEEISWERVIILFIITDEQENHNIDKDNFLQHYPNYKELVKKCGERFHLFSFSQTGNSNQLLGLLEKIKKMVGGNNGICEEDTTSKTDTANKTKDEREISYIQEPLPKSQRTIWISGCSKDIKKTEEQSLPDNSETSDSETEFEKITA